MRIRFDSTLDSSKYGFIIEQTRLWPIPVALGMSQVSEWLASASPRKRLVHRLEPLHSMFPELWFWQVSFAGQIGGQGRLLLFYSHMHHSKQNGIRSGAEHESYIDGKFLTQAQVSQAGYCINGVVIRPGLRKSPWRIYVSRSPSYYYPVDIQSLLSSWCHRK